VLLILGAAMAVKSLAIAHRDPPAPVPALAPARGVAAADFAGVFASDSAGVAAGLPRGMMPGFGRGPDLLRDSLRDSVPAPAVYNGRAGQLAVTIPRLDTDIDVDGTLTAPAWQHAAVLTGFSEYLPVDGQVAADSTEVLVWYSHSAIYFGIRAYEPHGAVHAALANRDAIDADDNVQLILSPFLHSRQALVFAVNPFGVQEDGTITEGATSQSGFGVTNLTGPPPTDLSPDFVYESKGHLTPFGYEVVVRIPFRSIKYQSAATQDWGLNIIRRVQHSGISDSWYPAKLAAASFLAQAGTLDGLTGLQRGLTLDLNPFVTENVAGSGVVAPGAGWQYSAERPQLGTNVRWGITNNLTLNGTYRPDFAEVESDATQLVLDPRQAVQYPEKRPFFLEGLEQFDTPNNLIYTRQIVAPIDAAKLVGKIGNISVAYLGAQDDEGSPAAGGLGHPTFDILRMQQPLGEASQAGVALTDKENGGSYNRMASADARFTFLKLYSIAVQAAGSSTRGDTAQAFYGPSAAPSLQATAGPLWETHFVRAGRTFGLNYDVIGIDPEFVAASGFISRAGVGNMVLDHRFTLYGPPTGLLQTIGADVMMNDTWDYRRFTSAQAPEDRRYHFTGITSLRGGWNIQAGIYFESYGYDPTLYGNYFLGHIGPHDTTYTKFVGTPTIPNTDYVLQIATPEFSKFDLSLLQLGGRDENFFEWSAADIFVTELTMDYRPTGKLRAQLMYNAQIYLRHDDGTAVARTLIPRLDVEYQLSRPIFFRIVAQYDAAYQDSLRDDARTELPIFTFNPATGTYTRAGLSNSNQLQVSGLFSYQPVPGTVAFIGYGNNLDEPEAFHFTTLRRTADNFFVKFSYLFRL
jgi:hypothetical protein